MPIHTNRMTLSVEGDRVTDVWIEPWGDLVSLRSSAPIDVEVTSPEGPDNIRLDFNPAEFRITISLQARVGKVRFLSGTTVQREWSAGTLPATAGEA
jgi:hypothetical protein